MGIVLIFRNEQRALQTYTSLQEGEKLVHTVDSDKIDTDKTWQLIHVTWKITTDNILADEYMWITFPEQTLKVAREVAFFQRDELKTTQKTTNSDGSTIEKEIVTYTSWRFDHKIDSTYFQQPAYKNPTHTHIDDTLYTADSITLWAYLVWDDAVKRIHPNEPFVFAEHRIEVDTGAITPPATIISDTIYLSSTDIAPNIASPKIGDARVHYTLFSAQEMSLIAKQDEWVLRPYQTKAGDELLLVTTWIQSAQQMFSDAFSSNRFLTWIMRCVGTFVLYGWLLLLVNWLTSLISKIPFMGTFITGGIQVWLFVIALLSGLLFVAIAWFLVRPVVSALLLLIFVIWLYGWKKYRPYLVQ